MGGEDRKCGGIGILAGGEACSGGIAILAGQSEASPEASFGFHPTEVGW